MSVLSGYAPTLEFFATRYQQGGRQVYAIDLALTQIAELLPAPDPANPTEGNRRVKESHAREFANYVRNEPHWVAPALVLRAPEIFTFEVRETIPGTDFGVLSFPKLAATDLRILDGQHRTLGIHIAIKEIARDLEQARSSLSTARRSENTDDETNWQNVINRLNEQRVRLGTDRTTIQIFIEDDSKAYKQMFFDIAENALGITSSVKARFDSRKVVNRALEGVMKHSLLAGRVDPEQDRMTRTNANLMGAKHVTEIIRTLAVGLEGRVGRRIEDSLNEAELVENTNRFLDTLVNGFPDLAHVADGELSPINLRQTSLLGSTVMLRVLAGVYEELVNEEEFTDDDITDFFRHLAPAMRGATARGSVWVTQVPNNVFDTGALAPRSRRQDLKTLRDTIVEWARMEPSWLGALDQGN